MYCTFLQTSLLYFSPNVFTVHDPSKDWGLTHLLYITKWIIIANNPLEEKLYCHTINPWAEHYVQTLCPQIRTSFSAQQREGLSGMCPSRGRGIYKCLFLSPTQGQQTQRRDTPGALICSDGQNDTGYNSPQPATLPLIPHGDYCGIIFATVSPTPGGLVFGQCLSQPSSTVTALFWILPKPHPS